MSDSKLDQHSSDSGAVPSGTRGAPESLELQHGNRDGIVMIVLR